MRIHTELYPHTSEDHRSRRARTRPYMFWFLVSARGPDDTLLLAYGPMRCGRLCLIDPDWADRENPYAELPIQPQSPVLHYRLSALFPVYMLGRANLCSTWNLIVCGDLHQERSFFSTSPNRLLSLRPPTAGRVLKLGKRLTIHHESRAFEGTGAVHEQHAPAEGSPEDSLTPYLVSLRIIRSHENCVRNRL